MDLSLTSCTNLDSMYKECQKNHAASLGGHALDGCGEFMPSPSTTLSDPTSLTCAACGCHRNFHRRHDPDDPYPAAPSSATATLEFHPYHRHHPLPPSKSPNSSPPPPPISSAHYSIPQMLLSLAGSGGDNGMLRFGSGSRKRVRTRFSHAQKERMFQFAERVGWKMQKRDQDLVQEFCKEVGVDKSVLKVWMHNNKNTSSKREVQCDHVKTEHQVGAKIEEIQPRDFEGNGAPHACTNGSSSSS